MMELTCTEFDYVILYLDLSFGELVWFKGAKMMMRILKMIAVVTNHLQLSLIILISLQIFRNST